jgi:hypothetical protein
VSYAVATYALVIAAEATRGGAPDAFRVKSRLTAAGAGEYKLKGS